MPNQEIVDYIKKYEKLGYSKKYLSGYLSKYYPISQISEAMQSTMPEKKPAKIQGIILTTIFLTLLLGGSFLIGLIN